ncbi:MAG: replicative DNA helicase [Firmicutes bacterium HGW-Firmicutes-16]|nr:MAG: replicative DNA helicase [Firmicutes bacterium HGW-Firmicutes-16]
MDELFELRVPHSAEAEQAVIGSLLIDPACIPDVLQKARSDDFYLQTNRDVFDTISNMYIYGRTVDPVTTLDQMRIRGCLKDNSQSYLLELMQVTPTAANVMKYVDILREQSLLRALLKVGGEITTMVREGSGEADTMLEASERKIYALRQGRTIGGLIKVANVIQDVYNQISEMAASGVAMPGIPTGLHDLDSAILGLNKGDLVLIASRPGMGKTSIALNIAMHAAKVSKKTVAIFSLEMSREQLGTRLLAGEGLIDAQKLLTGRLSPADWQRIGTAASTISETEILIDDNPSLSVADMNSQCRRLDNLGLVVIDYLQLMQSAGNGRSYSGENRQQAVSDMSRMLKIMAKELNVPVICLSQLSRANEGRSDKRPLLSDLRESGAIEQDADIVIGLFREGYYDRECATPNEAEAIILKNRHGELKTVPLMWLPEYTSYVSAERHHDDDDY